MNWERRIVPGEGKKEKSSRQSTERKKGRRSLAAEDENPKSWERRKNGFPSFPERGEGKKKTAMSFGETMAGMSSLERKEEGEKKRGAPSRGGKKGSD